MRVVLDSEIMLLGAILTLYRMQIFVSHIVSFFIVLFGCQINSLLSSVFSLLLPLQHNAPFQAFIPPRCLKEGETNRHREQSRRGCSDSSDSHNMKGL